MCLRINNKRYVIKEKYFIYFMINYREQIGDFFHSIILTLILIKGFGSNCGITNS